MIYVWTRDIELDGLDIWRLRDLTRYRCILFIGEASYIGNNWKLWIMLGQPRKFSARTTSTLDFEANGIEHAGRRLGDTWRWITKTSLAVVALIMMDQAGLSHSIWQFLTKAKQPDGNDGVFKSKPGKDTASRFAVIRSSYITIVPVSKTGPSSTRAYWLLGFHFQMHYTGVASPIPKPYAIP